MEKNHFSCSSSIYAFITILLVSLLSPQVSGQVTTGCTSSLLLSFTPCINFLTSSTNGGGSPTTECCKSLAYLITSATQCGCLIVTGNVPFSLPINRTLAISLPKLCNSQSATLKCQGTAMPLPSSGPVSYGPSLTPLTPAVPAVTTPSLAPTLDQPTPALDQLLPSASINLKHVNSLSLQMILLLAAIVLNKF